jgi:hypothetical protein
MNDRDRFRLESGSSGLQPWTPPSARTPQRSDKNPLVVERVIEVEGDPSQINAAHAGHR